MIIRVVLFFLTYVLAVAAQANEIVIGVPVKLGHLDPINLKSLEEWEAYGAIHEPLIRYDENETYIPAGAKKWLFDTDKRTVTFWLRDDFKFSDGSKITANDVVRTFKRILLIDKTGTHTLSRCFDKGKRDHLKRLDRDFYGITALDENTVIFKFDSCNSSILPSFANADFGILKIEKDRKKLQLETVPKAVSGLYTYKVTADGLILNPNKYSFWWAKTKETISPTIVYKYWGTEFSSDNIKDYPDMFRLADGTKLESLKRIGFNVMYSIPIMTWYIVPNSNYSKDRIKFDNVMHDLQSNLDLNNVSYFKTNGLENIASSFFPKEFNCDAAYESPKGTHHKVINRSDYEIFLKENPSGESKVFSDQIRNELAKMGYRLVNKETEGSLNFTLNRQFLGDDLPYVFKLVFKTFHAIPDPDSIFDKYIDELDSAEKLKQSSILKSMCARLYHYNHLPLAHRKYVLLAKDKKMFRLFSKISGTIYLEKIAETQG